MKKTFLNRRNALLSPGGLSLGVLACVIVAILLLLRLLFPNLLFFLISPLAHVGTALSSSTASLRAGFTDNARLLLERDTFASQAETLSVDNQRLVAKIVDLEKMLGHEVLMPEGVVAGVLARPPESPYDTLLVSGGADVGVVEGMTAFAPGGSPLGRVDSVQKKGSRITLLSTSGLRTDGWVGVERVPTTLIGAGGGTFTAEVPKTVAVAVGDVVYAPGPGALPIGSVERIDTSASASSAVLRIRPLVNIFSLTWVLLHQ